MRYPTIVHHGAVTCVADSCHQLQMDDEHALLTDCGLFQGAETSRAGLGDARHDVLFVGYQAEGTPGRQIQRFGPRGGYVVFDGQRYEIRAHVTVMGGYSAHADQLGLVRFVTRMSAWSNEIRLVHGDKPARRALADILRERYVDQSSGVDILLPGIDEEAGMG